MTDLHEKWDSEIAKADKLEIENKKIGTKLLSLQREKDNLLQERDTLKEACEELRCSNLQTSGSYHLSIYCYILQTSFLANNLYYVKAQLQVYKG